MKKLWSLICVFVLLSCSAPSNVVSENLIPLERLNFSNKEINRFFDLKEVLDEDYENFIDLYLDGGLDGDESPIDEFKLVKYSQVVYPREKYTYTNNYI